MQRFKTVDVAAQLAVEELLRLVTGKPDHAEMGQVGEYRSQAHLSVHQPVVCYDRFAGNGTIDQFLIKANGSVDVICYTGESGQREGSLADNGY